MSLDISNVHLLLVEDNQRYLERLEKRLRKYGYQHIKTALNADAARQELEKSHFDVIVADMRMEKDDSGFEIIDIVKEFHLSSIVIILTANDTVEDCRKALKGKGAWDYISKTMANADSMEELHKSVQEALEYFNRWGNVQDKTWINENIGYLLNNYRNQFVAVLNNKVIESDSDKSELEKRIIDKKLPLFLTVIEKIDDELFKQLSAKLIIFVEGPTDVSYIRTAFKLLGRDDLSENVIVDNIGNRIGDQGGGHGNLKNGFNFLKEKRLITGNVLFLADQDVSDKDLPNNGKNFENLYVRRVPQYSDNDKGIEWLFSKDIFEEGILQGFVTKTITTKISKAGSESRETYKITDKIRFCEWICHQRENTQADFERFKDVFKIFDDIISG